MGVRVGRAPVQLSATGARRGWTALSSREALGCGAGVSGLGRERFAGS